MAAPVLYAAKIYAIHYLQRGVSEEEVANMMKTNRRFAGMTDGQRRAALQVAVNDVRATRLFEVEPATRTGIESYRGLLRPGDVIGVRVLAGGKSRGGQDVTVSLMINMPAEAPIQDAVDAALAWVRGGGFIKRGRGTDVEELELAGAFELVLGGFGAPTFAL